MSVERRNLYQVRLKGEEPWQTVAARRAPLAALLEAIGRVAHRGGARDGTRFTVEVRDNGLFAVNLNGGFSVRPEARAVPAQQAEPTLTQGRLL